MIEITRRFQFLAIGLNCSTKFAENFGLKKSLIYIKIGIRRHCE